jgi:hypothetical protein
MIFSFSFFRFFNDVFSFYLKYLFITKIFHFDDKYLTVLSLYLSLFLILVSEYGFFTQEKMMK